MPPGCHLPGLGRVSLLELLGGLGGLLGCTDTQGTEEHPGGITHPVPGSVCRGRRLPQSYKEMREPGPCRLSITHQEAHGGEGPGPASAPECLAGARGDSALGARNGWSEWGAAAARVPQPIPWVPSNPGRALGGNRGADGGDNPTLGHARGCRKHLVKQGVLCKVGIPP